MSRTGNTAAWDFPAAPGRGGVIRRTLPEQLFRPISVVTLWLATTNPVLQAALPCMLLAWLAGAILRPGLALGLPALGDVFSFLEPEQAEPEVDSDKNPWGAGPQDQGAESDIGGGQSGSSENSGDTGGDEDGESQSDGSGGEGKSEVSQVLVHHHNPSWSSLTRWW